MNNRPIYREIGNCRVIDFGAAGAETLDVIEMCERISWDENARVVLLFFGPEVNDLLKPKLEAGQPSPVEVIAKLKQPIIAAIRGDALGLCLELALACDIRIGIDSAHFGLTQVQAGGIPSHGGTQRLPRLVGQGKALHMILTGETIDAVEALRIGLLNRVASPESLPEMASELATGMAAKSPLSLSYAKEALYGGGDLTLDQGIRMELDMYLLLFSTADRTEGISAFREKSKPEFKGH